MRITQIVSGTAVVIAALACAHKQQEPGASDSRIKPSSATTARDTAAEYGNQGTRMGASSDSSGREQTRGTTSGSATGTAGQNDPSLIGSPAWWRTHLTADGKPRP
jgi:hypothetical protein